MPRPKALIISLTLAATLALGLAACGGGSDLLSGTTASEINSNLDTVRELVEKGDCAGAEEAVDKVKTQVDELEGVNGELKEALSEAATHLRVVVSGCEEVEAEEATSNPAEGEETEEDEEREREERPPKPKPEENETANEPGGQEQGEEGEEGEEGGEEGPEESESPSGGVSPGTPAGEG